MIDSASQDGRESLPRLGWIDSPSPTTPLPALAKELGLESLTIKRDDHIGMLHGSTKVRKLDHLLAVPAIAEAPGWVSVGAIGSGHLTCLAAAARELGRRFEVVTFWEPPSPHVLENLAFTASRADRLTFVSNRAMLLLRRPYTLLAKRWRDLAVIPPGATTPAGMAGTYQAGLELAAQVAAGELPAPDRLVVALGTGGTVVGLSLGLARAGLRPVIQAVAVVERPLSTRGRLRRLQRALGRYLEGQGCRGLGALELPPLEVDRSQLGRWYGVATPASTAACERLAGHGLHLEEVYTGKAMAAVLAQGARRPGENVAFWLTVRQADPLEAAPDWRSKLPPALARRLDRA